MKKVKQQTARKIGLFSAIMVIFGAVVGIGIFFKNKSVFEANNNNWIGVLFSWVIAIIMAICMALSFAEAGTCKLKNKGDGLGGWASAYCGNQFGRYTKLSHTLNYFPVIIFAVAVFTGEACLNCFEEIPGSIDYGHLTTLYVFIIGLGIFVLFVILNMVCSKAMNKFSDIAGIVKFIPLLAVIFLGIIFGILNGGNGIWPGGKISGGQFSVVGMIGSIPAILFAFEGYTIIGSISNDMKDPERNVSLAIIIAMVIVSVLNLAITIGCMTAGVGNVYDLMDIVFGQRSQLAKIFNIIMSVFIFICIIGVLNALTFSGVRALQTNCNNGTLFKGKALANAKPNNQLFAGSIYLLLITTFWFIVFGIPSALFNTDAIADGATNILIIYFYIIYGIILIGAFANRFNKKVANTKIKVFPVTCIIGIICCFFIFSFSGIYQCLIKPIMDPYAPDLKWRLFVDSTFELKNWIAAAIFWASFVIMTTLPLFNDLLIKYYDKSNKQSLIWNKSNISKHLN